MLLNKTKKRTRNGDCKVVVSKAVWSMRVKWGRKRRKKRRKKNKTNQGKKYIAVYRKNKSLFRENAKNEKFF